MTQMNDVSHRFRLERAGIRGGFVRLDSSWAGVCEHADYPEPVSRLLGEALAASALFAGTLSFEGALSIHLRSAGALRLVFAECSHSGKLRGIARCDDDDSPNGCALPQPDTRLAITIDNAQTETRYQGLVAVESDTLAQAFEGYFERSEQLPTRVVLAQAHGRCGGLMLQQVAESGGKASVGDDDAWNRVGHLLATLSEQELLELSPEILLHRLFHEENVVLEPGRPLAFECSCSPARVTAMLRALGKEESEAALQEQGDVSVTCEFCNRLYRFDRVDLAMVFAADVVPPGSQLSQ